LSGGSKSIAIRHLLKDGNGFEFSTVIPAQAAVRRFGIQSLSGEGDLSGTFGSESSDRRLPGNDGVFAEGGACAANRVTGDGSTTHTVVLAHAGTQVFGAITVLLKDFGFPLSRE